VTVAKPVLPRCSQHELKDDLDGVASSSDRQGSGRLTRLLRFLADERPFGCCFIELCGPKKRIGNQGFCCLSCTATVSVVCALS